MNIALAVVLSVVFFFAYVLPALHVLVGLAVEAREEKKLSRHKMVFERAGMNSDNINFSSFKTKLD